MYNFNRNSSSPILRAPRTLDVAQHLHAEVVVRGELDTRRVTEVVTAARSVPEVIPRLRPGVLVITSGDRDDVIIACALAASRGIELAELLLTHASEIAPQVMEFAGPALASGLPILRSADDSYATARRVSHIPATVPRDDLARMNTVLDAVAEHLDAATISAAFHLQENTKLSPPAFRYQLIQKARAARKRNLNTGNTTYKAVQRSANVVSVGPMLQGLRKPVNDLSRGALVDDIVFTIALTAIQAQQGAPAHV